MTKEVGTLAEIGAKSGDVVECVEWWGEYYNTGQNYPVVDGLGVVSQSIGTKAIWGMWRIVSRASGKLEPKIETVHLMNFHDLAKGHAIVFTVKDGEPDCTSIKMEKLQ